MKRFAIWLAVALLLPLAAQAAPTVSGPTPGGGGTWYEWSVTFDGTTDDSRGMAVTPTQCSFSVTYGGSGSVQLWQVSGPGDTATGGSQVGSTISAQPNSPTTFSPGRSYVKARASVASSGTTMVIRCSNTQVTSGGGVDAFSVADFGAAADGVTNDEDAFNAAIAAACATDNPQVYVPTGEYALGAPGASQVFSGARLTCSNLTMFGDGPTSKLYVVGTHGNYAIYACAPLTNAVATCSTQLTDITVRDLWIEDQDPEAHGFHYDIWDEGVLTGGTPAFGDIVTWTGGGGTVQSYSGGQIRIDLTSGAISGAEDITNGVWTATGATVVSSQTPEESHGFGCKNVDGLTLERLWFRDISDESIDLQLNCTNNKLTHIDARGCNQVGAGGACVAVGSGANGVISDSYLEGGAGTAAETGAVINIGTNNAGTGVSYTVSNVRVIENGLGAANQVERGIATSAAATTAPVDANIVNAYVEHDNGSLANRAIGGGSTSSQVTVTVTNSRVLGSISHPAADRVSYVNVQHTDTDTGNTLASISGVDSIVGGRYSCENCDSVVNVNADGTVISGAIISNQEDNAINITAADGTMISDTYFEQCGDGGFDFCVRELSGSDYTLLTNVTIGTFTSANDPFRVGTTNNATCDGSGTGANSVCDTATHLDF